MNSMLLILIAVVSIPLYVVPCLESFIYQFMIVQKYEGMRLGSLLRALFVTFTPIVNFHETMLLHGIIERSMDYSAWRILSGSIVDEEDMLFGPNYFYYPQESPIIRRVFIFYHKISNVRLWEGRGIDD